MTRGTVHQLEIAEIFPEDSGKYTCEALNDHGEAESSATINVLGKDDSDGFILQKKHLYFAKRPNVRK